MSRSANSVLKMQVFCAWWFFGRATSQGLGVRLSAAAPQPDYRPVGHSLQSVTRNADRGYIGTPSFDGKRSDTRG